MPPRAVRIFTPIVDMVDTVSEISSSKSATSSTKGEGVSDASESEISDADCGVLGGSLNLLFTDANLRAIPESPKRIFVVRVSGLGVMLGTIVTFIRRCVGNFGGPENEKKSVHCSNMPRKSTPSPGH